MTASGTSRSADSSHLDCFLHLHLQIWQILCDAFYPPELRLCTLACACTPDGRGSYRYRVTTHSQNEEDIRPDVD
jgi:hypothetical protein